MAEITRLNHAVLYVSDLDRSVEFYKKAFGFNEVDRMGDRMAFLRAANNENHHDLGLMSVGKSAQKPPRGATGLYHLAWEVGSIDDLAEAASALSELDALTGMSDHGVSKSLYGVDPDGIEFELMWRVPREDWGEYEEKGVVMPLNLSKELAKYGQRASA
jgi:catechol-2,3-dioxygenase